MNWLFSYISWIYLITAIVCLQLVLVVFNMQKVKGRVPFQWMMFMSAFWSFVLVFESAAPTIPVKVIWSQLEYLANLSIPLILLRFILTFNDDKNLWIKRFYGLFWIIPVLTFLLVLTNTYHNLIWTGFSWSPAGMNILTYHHGFMFYFGMAYSLGLIIFSEVVLIWLIKSQPADFKVKTRYLVTASAMPLLTSLLYILGLSPVEGLNIAPMGLLVFGLIFLRGSAREKLFDLVPFSHQLMIEKMGDGVVVLDKNRKILDISPPALMLLNLNIESVGKQVKEVLPYLDPVVDSTANSEEMRMEIQLENSGQKWIEMYRFPLRDPNGHFLGNLLLLHDISKRKQNEVQLKKLADELTELNSMKDRLYTVIGHDLRSPFNALLGFSELLIESFDEFSEEERKKFAFNINEVARNTYELLGNLLEWSTVQLGKTNYAPEKITLHQLVEQTFQLLHFNASGKGVTLLNNVSPDLVITADKNMTLTIIRNLVSNGIKFCTDKGTVEVLAMQRGNVVDIIVADTGIGMTPQIADQLFRIDSLITTSGTADEKGTGLGLILCKEFVERHNGKIRVTTEPELGSRFIVTLPANPPTT